MPEAVAMFQLIATPARGGDTLTDRRELWRIGALGDSRLQAAASDRIAPYMDFSTITARLI